MAGTLTQLTIKILAVKAAGSGCPQAGDIKATLSDDRSELVIEAPEVSARAGDGKRTLDRKNCEILISLSGAAGVQATAKSVVFPLESALAPKAKADVLFRSYASGQTGPDSARLDLPEGDKARKDQTLDLPPSWSTCSKDLTLVEGLALIVRGNEGLSTLTSGTPWRLKLAWRPC